MKNNIERTTWAPEGFWEKAENVLNKLFSKSPIDWEFRNFKKAMIRDNPFLNRASDAFIRAAFNAIKNGASPDRSSLTFRNKIVKYANAIRHIMPLSFEDYLIVKLEAKGVPVPGNYNPDMFPFLTQLRNNDNFKSKLDFIVQLSTEPLKAKAVVQYLIALEKLENSYYEVDRKDFETWRQDVDDVHFDFNEVEYKRAIKMQQQSVKESIKEVDHAKEVLTKIGVSTKNMSKLNLNYFMLEETLAEIQLENSVVMGTHTPKKIESQKFEDIAKKFQVNMNEGNSQHQVQTKVASKGISL